MKTTPHTDWTMSDICKGFMCDSKARICKQSEMDADHVTAWSRGGKTNAKNCQMLAGRITGRRGTNETA